MSYEGYDQILCENGHYHEHDCYEPLTGWVCDDLIDGKKCGSGLKVANAVDETNCDGYGYREPIKLTPEVTQTCDLGHAHIVSEATFKLSDTRYYRETLYDEKHNPVFKWIPYCEDSAIND